MFLRWFSNFSLERNKTVKTSEILFCSLGHGSAQGRSCLKLKEIYFLHTFTISNELLGDRMMVFLRKEIDGQEIHEIYAA